VPINILANRRPRDDADKDGEAWAKRELTGGPPKVIARRKKKHTNGCMADAEEDELAYDGATDHPPAVVNLWFLGV
jgi:hypothetical protein